MPVPLFHDWKDARKSKPVDYDPLLPPCNILWEHIALNLADSIGSLWKAAKSEVTCAVAIESGVYVRFFWVPELHDPGKAYSYRKHNAMQLAPPERP